MDPTYNHKEIEARWQKRWEAARIFKSKPDPGRPKYYVLEMFPYPSGRIHMGHVRNYSIGDVVARVKRMEGYNVLYPMGWDAFGMPAENAALAAKIHPRTWTFQNIDAMRAQLKRMGFSYDWDRELATCDPRYYRWEQQVFLRMYERGLVYRKGAFVNWCSTCKTVLANEQVEAGKCWRCSTEVVQKELNQWFFQITRYTEELLNDLDSLKADWPEQVLAMQRNWIGKSHGARISFELEKEVAGHRKIDIFTTRPDTLYGATFFSLAAEHPLALELARGTEREAEVASFVHRVRNEDKMKRSSEDYVKEGCNTGAKVINPVNGEAIPIFIANFVLMEYGTGAIMAVPAHDQRDFDFARRYGIPIRVVIDPPDRRLSAGTMEAAYEEPGIMVSSGPFDGMESEKGKAAVVEHLKGKGMADFTVHYRLRDWGISRQRYWGAPIPMIHCPECGIVPVPEEQLPVTLPNDVVIDYEGGSPLTKHPTWSKVACPACGKEARRETDTMDTFVESSWYFFRYCSPWHDQGVFDKEETEYWMNVDQYIGGIEHAIMHLLYARFYTKILRDLGFTRVDEPFQRLFTQGMVCMESFRCPEHGWLYPSEVKNGVCSKCNREVIRGRIEAMSKSRKNVVDPEEILDKYGADTIRLFILSDSPPERNVEWSDTGVEGASKFVLKVHRAFLRLLQEAKGARFDPKTAFGPESTALRRTVHKTLVKVRDDVTRRFHFNTAIAEIRVLVSALAGFNADTEEKRQAAMEAMEKTVLLMAPFMPHLAEELWQALGREDLAAAQPFPIHDPDLVTEDVVTLGVQVNGKLRARIKVPADADNEAVERKALEDQDIQRHVQGKKVVKVIVVPGRLVSLVVK